MRCLISIPFALAFALALPAAEVKLTPAGVEVTGVPKESLAKLKDANLTPAEWNRLLRVVVAEGTADEIAARPPLAGEYSVTGDAVRFAPQFPLTPGVKYRATFAPAGGNPVTADLFIPKPPPGPPVSVAAVYPSGNRLPENTLRWYVHFTAPVERGDIYRHVKLLKADGTEVSFPFLELDEELWSDDGKRVTFLFHPGRVKRGLKPREEEGPILEAGRTYTLVIDKNWKDAAGRPLASEFRKTFSAAPPDDDPVDPANWQLVPPRAGTDSPLIVRLAKPLDHALLGRWVWVADATGKKVAGTTTVGGNERVLTFAPEKPWAVGEYKLVADTRLEDVCGNRVGEPFEVDVFKPVTRKIEAKTADRPFRVPPRR
jgi:hypothetical protein